MHTRKIIMRQDPMTSNLCWLWNTYSPCSMSGA
jgi:hypothetical protein